MRGEVWVNFMRGELEGLPLSEASLRGLRTLATLMPTGAQQAGVGVVSSDASGRPPGNDTNG